MVTEVVSICNQDCVKFDLGSTKSLSFSKIIAYGF